MVPGPVTRFVSLLAAAAVAALGTLASAQTHEDLDTPFVVTPDNVVNAMLDLASVRAGDRLIDLGSGDGRIVIAAAQRGATGVGIDIDRYLVEKSRETARKLKLEDRARFVTQDLFETDFRGYDVVTLYLLPDVNKRLAPKFLALPPGTRIVSHDYGLGDWPADETIVVDAPDKAVNVEKVSRLMFWVVPAQVAGRWGAEVAGRQLSIDLRQRYQHVSGTLRFAGREYAITEQKVRGRELALRVGAGDAPTLQLDLRANGEVLAGQLREAGRAPVDFTARRAG